MAWDKYFLVTVYTRENTLYYEGVVQVERYGPRVDKNTVMALLDTNAALSIADLFPFYYRVEEMDDFNGRIELMEFRNFKRTEKRDIKDAKK